MTELTNLNLDYYCNSYMHLLTQHCYKLTTVKSNFLFKHQLKANFYISIIKNILYLSLSIY